MRPFLQEAVDALPDWWERIDSDPAWRKYGEYGLAAGYGLIALVALIQLVRQPHAADYAAGTDGCFASVASVPAACQCQSPASASPFLSLGCTRRALHPEVEQRRGAVPAMLRIGGSFHLHNACTFLRFDRSGDCKC